MNGNRFLDLQKHCAVKYVTHPTSGLLMFINLLYYPVFITFYYPFTNGNYFLHISFHSGNACDVPFRRQPTTDCRVRSFLDHLDHPAAGLSFSQFYQAAKIDWDRP